jgi:hypothetical protein
VWTGDFEAGAFGEQSRALLDAAVLVAAHGAALSGALLLPRGATVVEILPETAREPPWRTFHPIPAFRTLCARLGLRYAAVYAEEVEPEAEAAAAERMGTARGTGLDALLKKSLRVDPEALAAAVEEGLAAAAREEGGGGDREL